MATVLVCGATGTTGSEVLRQLQAQGVGVRTLTRSERSATRLRDAGVEAVVGDLQEPSTLPACLKGIDAVYVASPAALELPAHEGNLARAAAEAGVKHLVKLSVLGAGADAPITFGRLHFHAEEQIRQSGVGWTMLRANGFMQNTLAWAPQIATGSVYGPIMDARWSIVDIRDIAAVASAVLQDPDHHGGAVYSLTGPEAGSPREQIAILSEVLGRELIAQEVSIDQAKASMIDGGLSDWYAERLGELLSLFAEGVAEAISPDVQRVTGRPPRTYRQFASDHVERFGD